MARRSREQLVSDVNYLIGELQEKVKGIPDLHPHGLKYSMDMKTLYEYEKALQGALKSMKSFM